MIRLLAAIGFIGILIHVIKSWIDWRDVRNRNDLLAVMEQYTTHLSRHYFPVLSLLDKTAGEPITQEDWVGAMQEIKEDCRG